MRVLLASSVRGLGGGEEWFLAAARLLLERGHHAILAARSGSDLEREARARSLSVVGIPFGGVLDPRALFALHRVLVSERIEVAVTNLDKETRALALAALGTSPVALVPRRGSEIPLANDAINRWLFRRRVARILVNSSGIADRLRASLPALPEGTIALLPNGVDAVVLEGDERAALERLWHDGPGPRVITVGELSERKNQAGLVRALASVPLPWRLLIVGEGSGRAAIEREVLRLGLGDRVRLAGHVPGARRILAASDLAAHFSSSEGQPWSVLEGLASGIPTVATRLPGIEPLIEDGVTGRTVPPFDEVALARALAGLLADPHAARTLGTEARRRIAATHSAAQLGDRLERILEAARLARAPAPRRAIFLDRDGTLVPEAGALGDPERVRLLPGVGAALRLLDRAGWPLVVVTNQAAVGRGVVAPGALRAVHARLRSLVRAEGVELAGIFVCPHTPEDDCACRKPRPGLVLDAALELGLVRAGSWLVGDTAKDVAAARAAGVRAALLSTGWGGAERSNAAANARTTQERLATNSEAPEAELRAPDLLAFAEGVTRN